MKRDYRLHLLEGIDIFNKIKRNNGEIGDYFWDYYENITTEWIVNHVTNICDFINPIGEVLSIGCGHGLNEIYISDMCEDATSIKGIDLIEFKIKTMNQILKLFGMKNIIGIHANGMKMDFPDNSFDTVIIIESLSHADDQEKVLKEAARVLKKNGSIFVLDFNNGANPRIWFRSWKQRHFEDTIENIVNPYHVKNFLGNYGIRNITIEPYRHFRSFDFLKRVLLSKKVKLPPNLYLFVSKGFMLKGRKAD